MKVILLKDVRVQASREISSTLQTDMQEIFLSERVLRLKLQLKTLMTLQAKRLPLSTR